MTRVAPPPEDADIGIVAAMALEVAPLLARLGRSRVMRSARHKIILGELGGKWVAVVLVGMGRAAARRGAKLLLDGHRPRWLVSAGFGGALDPTLSRNDVVLPDEGLDEAGVRWSLDLSMPADPSSRFRTGRLLTVDRVILTAAEKAELRERYHASVLDMETSAVAEVCRDRAVRFLALRVISDEAGADLPREIAAITGPTGSFRLGAAAGAIWSQPASLKELWTLRDHALAASQTLANVLPPVLAQLP